MTSKLTAVVIKDGEQTVQIRNAPLLSIGEFPADTGGRGPLKVTREYLRSLVRSFGKEGGTAQINIEHIPTVFAGRLGELVAVRLSPGEMTLLGDLDIPLWLDLMLPQPGLRGISVDIQEIGGDAYITGLALTLNPADPAAILPKSVIDWAAVEDLNREMSQAKATAYPSGMPTRSQLRTLAAMATGRLSPPVAAGMMKKVQSGAFRTEDSANEYLSLLLAFAEADGSATITALHERKAGVYTGINNLRIVGKDGAVSAQKAIVSLDNLMEGL